MDFLFSADAIVAFLTLTFLEIVLGIDNIIFISIATGKLPESQRKRATQVGMFLAMFMRIALLLGISYLIAMKEPWLTLDLLGIHSQITGQSLILFSGGLFLIYKSTKEIREKVEDPQHDSNVEASKATKSFQSVIFQIILIDLVFSFDSILTAVGMTNGIPGALFIMIAAVVVSVFIMMLFAVPVGNFVNANPSLQVLGLAFLILIGFMLITEGAHLSHTEVLGQSVGAVPKGYLYFAISFSLAVEFINMKMRKKVQ